MPVVYKWLLIFAMLVGVEIVSIYKAIVGFEVSERKKGNQAFKRVLTIVIKTLFLWRTHF
jgi:hypothetical protein